MEFLGLLLPTLIDMLNRRVKDSDARFLISIFVCIIIGAGLNYLETLFMFDSAKEAFESITVTIGAVFGMAQVSYRLVYEDSKLQTMLRGKQEQVVRE